MPHVHDHIIEQESNATSRAREAAAPGHGAHRHGGHGHGLHRHGEDTGGRNLLIALVLNVGITAAQIVGGLLSGSLALLADAAHNGSDAASLGVSYAARRIARRPADERRTFGYNRAEVVGALINLTTLFVIAVFLISQAIHRFFEPSDVAGSTMLIVGAIAFVEDAVSTWLLYQGAKSSLNIRSAFIHMMGDTLATLGVLVGGFLILRYQIFWIDPAITLAIALYIIVHGALEIRTAIRILMESAPKGFDFERMVREVEALEGVDAIHHVHLWRLDEERVALEAHVAVLEDDLSAIEEIKHRVKCKLRDDFGIAHATLEIEIAGRTGHDARAISCH